MFSFIDNKQVQEKLKASEPRIRKAYNTLFSGYDLKAEDILNDVVHVQDYNGLVKVEKISFYTFCEHHFLPFFGQATIVYEPNVVITGLGKIARLVRDLHSRKLQIQEIMNKDIADDIMRVLDAKGVYVETTAKHLCMCSRGTGDDNVMTTASYGCGTLKNYGELSNRI